MTAEGQSRHFDRAQLTSGLPQLADVLRVIRHVRKGPIADIASCARLRSERGLLGQPRFPKALDQQLRVRV